MIRAPKAATKTAAAIVSLITWALGRELGSTTFKIFSAVVLTSSRDKTKKTIIKRIVFSKEVMLK